MGCSKIHKKVLSRDLRIRHLANWLDNWRADRQTAKDFTPKKTPQKNTRNKSLIPENSLGKLINPFDANNLRAGDIRLISPGLFDLSVRPVYVATLKLLEKDRILVAPYGRFPVPATPGELLTGRSLPMLRVLCLWNAHAVPMPVLKQSWLCDRMSTREIRDSLTVLGHIRSGKSLPKELVSRVGLPVVHPDDPRFEYRDEEALMLAPLWLPRQEHLKPPSALQTSGKLVIIRWLEKYLTLHDRALAAQSVGTQYQEQKYFVPGYNLQLLIYTARRSGILGVLVTDYRGEPSRQLDGARIAGKSGDQSDPIKDGQATLAARIVQGGFRLQLPKGGTRELLSEN